MSMSVGPADSGEDESPMSDINTTPLVDVMLVMLIIFLITVPVVIQTVPLKLPNVANTATTTKPENVSISIDKNCDVFWGLEKFTSTQDILDRAVKKLTNDIEKQKNSGKPFEFPEVHIRGDADMEYRCAGKVIFLMQRAGYQKIAFISQPPPGFKTTR